MTTKNLGFVMLVHEALDRVAQVAGQWASKGSPVVIHADSRVSKADFQKLKQELAEHENIRFSDRWACDWGRFSIVEATQSASELLLDVFPDVRHVFLASGACLPLRPVKELAAFLNENKKTDFIESVMTEEVNWTVGGLDHERFTLRFPFSWKRNRKLFDRYVALQRRIGFSRAIPEGIEPHLGSQWWCLTRQTLSAILEDPERAMYDRYFQKVWIPDESYFQTLARKYSGRIASRSLTLSKFDHQGKPHIFYDDHQELLQQSDCFVARKIWSGADGLYAKFLSENLVSLDRTAQDPRKLERTFTKANQQRTKGRDGLKMQSRFPIGDYWKLKKTSAPYSVYEGFDDLFEDFDPWMEKRTGKAMHGHLFNKTEVKFAGNATLFNGCLSNNAKLRDNNPEAFLSNLIWNTQGEHQCFQFGAADAQDISKILASDPNASISVVSGAWAVPLFHSNLNFSRIRRIAARYQRAETAHLELLRSQATRADIHVWTLAEFIEDPMPVLQGLVDRLDPLSAPRLTEVPRMADLRGFGQFVQNLRNCGMNPHLIGDFPDEDTKIHRRPMQRPYVAQ